jgi:hypothetical protein
MKVIDEINKMPIWRRNAECKRVIDRAIRLGICGLVTAARPDLDAWVGPNGFSMLDPGLGCWVVWPTYDPAKQPAAIDYFRSEEAARAFVFGAEPMSKTDLPDLEPRSSTLDMIDDAIATLTHARVNVLDEVRYLGMEIDRLRDALRESQDARDGWRRRAEEAERALGESRG